MSRAVFIDRLNEAQVADLEDLYRLEWWTQGRTVDEIRGLLEHSDFVFGFCEPPAGRLIGFARVLTDRRYKALIFDVIVARSHRDRGLGKELMERILNHPELRQVRHFELYCLPDMVPFYERWGFSDDIGDLRLLRLERSPRPQSGANG